MKISGQVGTYSSRYFRYLSVKKDGQEIAQNFFETLSRLVRNLLSEDQQSDGIRYAWDILDSFLEPENFLDGSTLRHTISVVRADIVRQFCSTQKNRHAKKFSNKIDINDLMTGSKEFLWRQTITSLIHLSEFHFIYIGENHNFIPLIQTIDENLRAMSENRWSFFMLSVFEGCLHTAEAARRELNEDVNSHQSAGWTVLMVAAYAGQTEMVRWLLTLGANVHHSGMDDRWTALMAACANGYTETASLLLARGASVDQRTTDNGTTALFAACDRGHTGTAALLLDRGASVNQSTTDLGRTALMAACASGHTKTVALLLDRGASVNQSSMDDGRTALMVACAGGHTETAALLLDRGASVNQSTTDDGRTSLMAACVSGHTKTAALLLNRGANVNQSTTDNGGTALMAACAKGRTETVALLLEHGADANQRTIFGWTAIVFSVEAGVPFFFDIADLLLKFGADETDLFI